MGFILELNDSLFSDRNRNSIQGNHVITKAAVFAVPMTDPGSVVYGVSHKLSDKFAENVLLRKCRSGARQHKASVCEKLDNPLNQENRFSSTFDE